MLIVIALLLMWIGFLISRVGSEIAAFHRSYKNAVIYSNKRK